MNDREQLREIVKILPTMFGLMIEEGIPQVVATTLRQFYLAYLDAGFTEAQSMMLTTAMARNLQMAGK
jgi:hypothetical protein